MADLCKGIWVVVNFQLGSLFGSLLYSGTYYLKKGTLILTTTHIKASHKEPEDCTFSRVQAGLKTTYTPDLVLSC